MNNNIMKVSKIGEGSYGIVYSAVQVDASKHQVTTYALKRNLKDADIDFIASIKELDLLVRLRGHPYIVELLWVSFGNPFRGPMSPPHPMNHAQTIDDGVHFFFEKADCDLHDYFYKQHPSLYLLAQCMHQILMGVEYLHRQEIIHRDLKPSNILVFLSKNTITCKICDFGLAKPYTNQGVQTPKSVTHWYRSPEICLGDPHYSYGCDIWALGCIFFELVSGTALFYDIVDNDITILRVILEKIPILLTLSESNSLYGSSFINMNHRNMLYQNFDELLQAYNVKKSVFDSCKLSYSDFLLVLRDSLQILPIKRATATELLSSRFFSAPLFTSSLVPNRNEIKEKQMIHIVEGKERELQHTFSLYVLHHKEKFLWFKPRMVFMAVQLHNRYLLYKKKENEMQEENEMKRKLEFFVCLYISVKYFTTMERSTTFQDMIYALDGDHKEEWAQSARKYKLMAEDFERRLIQDVFHNHLYEPTLYECADFPLTDRDQKCLLCIMTKMKTIDGQRFRDILSIYKKYRHLRKI